MNVCLLLCTHSSVYPPFKGEAGVLAWCEQETMLVSDRGRECEFERGGESWRREGNEKFIRLHVPKALLCLPGALALKLLGRGGGSQPKGWSENTQIKGKIINCARP